MSDHDQTIASLRADLNRLRSAAEAVVAAAAAAFGERHRQIIASNGRCGEVIIDRYTDDTDDVRVCCLYLRDALKEIK